MEYHRRQIISSTLIRILPLLCLLLLARCKTTRKTTTTVTEDKSPTYLFEQLRKNELNYDWLSTKVSAQAKLDKASYSFNAALRSRKDSVIWISVSSALGIEVVRLYITPDSVKYINRLAEQNARYFEGNFSALKDLLGLDFDVDFQFFQSVITGNYHAQYPDSVFKASTNPRFYNLGTVNRRKLKKTMGGEEESFGIVKQDIRIEPDHFRIIRLMMNDLTENRKFETQYLQYKQVEGQWFPEEMEVDIHAKDKAHIRISHSKITLNKPQRFPFKAPE